MISLGTHTLRGLPQAQALMELAPPALSERDFPMVPSAECLIPGYRQAPSLLNPMTIMFAKVAACPTAPEGMDQATLEAAYNQCIVGWCVPPPPATPLSNTLAHSGLESLLQRKFNDRGHSSSSPPTNLWRADNSTLPRVVPLLPHARHGASGGPRHLPANETHAIGGDAGATWCDSC